MTTKKKISAFNKHHAAEEQKKDKKQKNPVDQLRTDTLLQRAQKHI